MPDIMMDEMTINARSAVLLLFLLLAGMAAFAGDLAQVHNVYILPMSGGLDLHLANRFTDGHIFQVVTDPKKADTIVTDKLGQVFENKMTELYPPPEPPKPEKDKDKGKEKDALSDIGSVAAGLSGDTMNKVDRPASSFGGGKGTIFLISVKSREVIWSTYAKPRDNRGETLEKTAGKVCTEIKKTMTKAEPRP
jgi:hypothetical protein